MGDHPRNRDLRLNQLPAAHSPAARLVLPASRARGGGETIRRRDTRDKKRVEILARETQMEQENERTV